MASLRIVAMQSVLLAKQNAQYWTTVGLLKKMSSMLNMDSLKSTRTDLEHPTTTTSTSWINDRGRATAVERRITCSSGELFVLL